MKYIVVVPDGAADEPLPELDGRTVLEAAVIPTFDRLAREGMVGLAATVPEGMHPGSDVANLSLLGYDPRKGYTGRAALEAASVGLEVPDGDAVYRANLVTVTDDGMMLDYSAGHISTEEATELIASLNAELGMDGITLYPGVGYRHLCLIQGMGDAVAECIPPHEIMDQPIASHPPIGGKSFIINDLQKASSKLLPEHPINLARKAAGKNPATQLWLWGGATAMRLDGFAARHRLISAGMISAVDLMRGIGKLTGMDVLDVEGANAYYDTNFAGKGQAALEYLRDHDFIVVHVEAPDEAGHNGDVKAKVKSLEDIDVHILRPLTEEAARHSDWRIMVAPDHPTPVRKRTHTADPIPFVLWGQGIAANGAEAFTEPEAARRGGMVHNGPDVIQRLFRS